MNSIKLCKILGIVFSFFLTSCNNKIEGKYVCKSERDAEHYVILREDSTFYHYYRKGDSEARVNEGRYEMSAGGGMLYFYYWEDSKKSDERGEEWIFAQEIFYGYFRKVLEFDMDCPENNFYKTKE